MNNQEDKRTNAEINGNLSIEQEKHTFESDSPYVKDKEVLTYGLTKREWLAGLAMQALAGNLIASNIAAARAVAYADELLKELEKQY